MKFRLKFINIKKLSYEEERNSFSFNRLLSIFLFTVLISYTLYIPQKEVLSSFNIKLGKPVVENIIFQKNVTVADKNKTEEERINRIKSLIPVYKITSNTEKTKKLINDLFTLLRKARKAILKNKNKAFILQKNIKQKFGINISVTKIYKIINSEFFTKINLNELIELFALMESRGILYSKNGLRKDISGRIKLISNLNKIEIRDINSFFDMKDVKKELIGFFNNQDLTARNSKIISEILLEFIEINVSYSEDDTKKEKNKIMNAISPVFVKFQKGRVFISRDEIVSPRHMYILKKIKTFNDLNKKKVSDFFLIFCILFVLFLFTDKFYKSFEPNILNSKKIFTVTLSTLFLSALIARISIYIIPVILNSLSYKFSYDITSVFYTIPIGFAALIIAFTFNLHSSVIFSFLNAIISAMICNWNFQIALYVLIGGLSVSFGIEYYQRLKRSPVLKAGLLWLLPANLFIIILFSINTPDIKVSLLLVNIILGICSAVLSSLLASFIIPLWESFFGLLTEVRLNELVNLSLPVFREMMEKAPGTYHHSQMVASLAEAAANDLDIPQMLLTSMALYHDIGKIDNPDFFTENHSMYKNPHLKISPKESAKMIKSHINDGLERAKKLKLPEEIIHAISQHHGTKLIKFFYDKAKEEVSVDTDKILPKDYRYTGEKPINIENGIIMLADQVEAASKSLSTPTEKEIKNVIRKIIDANINEGQFDECDGLTLKALNIIGSSFLKKLTSIYHTRISYPGFNFEEKK